MEKLQLLHDRLELLLKKYTTVQEENVQLKETLARQLDAMDTLNKQLARLETTLLTTQQSKKNNESGQGKTMRKQLDSVIMEIDKILSTLHD